MWGVSTDVPESMVKLGVRATYGEAVLPYVHRLYDSAVQVDIIYVYLFK